MGFQERKEGRKEGRKDCLRNVLVKATFSFTDCRCEIVGNSGRKTLIQREGEKIESIAAVQ